MNIVQFSGADQSFSDAVKNAVAEYFRINNMNKSGNRELYTKALVFIPAAAGLYLWILLGQYSLWMGVSLFFALGVVFSLIAVNVMHDACHGSFSEKKSVNYLVGLTMNALGSNAFLWKVRHTIHHTFTNVDGIDHDIDNWPLLRQSPTQPWKPAHRFQYLYMFPIYAFSTIEWMLVSDLNKYFSGKVSGTVIRDFSLVEHFIFWGSKFISVIAYVILPVLLLGWQHWLLGFLIVHFTMGFSLTLIFQLAHLVENTHFEIADTAVKQIEKEWAIHQVMTTSNFATDNRIVSWLAGGLNFQIEHHLFPFVSHVHYPAISRMVKEQCRIHHLPYHCYPTLGQALLSHINFMKELGKQKTYQAITVGVKEF